MIIDTTDLNKARYILETRFGRNPVHDIGKTKHLTDQETSNELLAQAIHYILDFINQQLIIQGDAQP